MKRWSLFRLCLGAFGIVGMSVLPGGCGEEAGGQAPDGSEPGTGGMVNAGGSSGGGGSSDTGGRSGSGGRSASGGTTASGGSETGGRTGGTRTGGRAGSGGSAGAGGGAGSSSTQGTGGSSSPDDAGIGPDTTPALDGGATPIEAGPAGVRLEGRFDFGEPTKPSFGWSGSAMIARFEGTGATLRIDGSPNQFAVVVDGAVSSKVLKVVSGTTQYAVASGLASGPHDLIVWKRTEGNQGDNRFLGLDVEGGQLLATSPAPDRRIEIYGDSITAGYGLDGKGPDCPWSADTENHYLTYGALTARELDAELHTIAWSGIGMYRNYGSSGASSDAMPMVYQRTLPSKSGSAWDFASWQPQVVIINLGTNDASTNGDPGTPYRNAYLEFVRTLRSKYADTFFVLTIGPMLDGSELTAIKGHIQAVIKTLGDEGDSRLSFLEFPVQQSTDGYGCDWHPSATTNAKMATLLVAELKTRLGW